MVIETLLFVHRDNYRPSILRTIVIYVRVVHLARSGKRKMSRQLEYYFSLSAVIYRNITSRFLRTLEGIVQTHENGV